MRNFVIREYFDARSVAKTRIYVYMCRVGTAANGGAIPTVGNSNVLNHNLIKIVLICVPICVGKSN